MKKSHKLIIVSSPIITIVGGIALITHWANQPSQANIVTKTANEQPDVRGTNLSLAQYESPFFSTRVPDTLRLKTSNEVSTESILAQYLLTDKDPGSTAQLAITIGKQSSNDIEELSSVKFRLNNPNDYHQEPTPAGFPQNARIFIHKNGYEKGVFWLQNDKYAAVVSSGDKAISPELNRTADDTVLNWQWK